MLLETGAPGPYVVAGQGAGSHHGHARCGLHKPIVPGDPLLPATPICPHVLLLLQTAEQASCRVLETVNFGRQAKKEQWL